MYVFKRLSNRKKEMEEEKREREKTRQGEEGETGTESSIYWISPQKPVTVRARQGESQEPEHYSVSLMGRKVSNILWSSSAVFPRHIRKELDRKQNIGFQ